MTSRTVDGHTIGLSNLDKVLFPQSGITKGDLVEYYRRIAQVALPHYRDRPLTMQRFPDGIGKDGFYQKDIPDYFPDWIDRVRLDKEGGTVTHAVANNSATLVYLANQGCVTPHLGLARRDKPDHPDRLIFDLDPSDDNIDTLRTAAESVKSALDRVSLGSFIQTTGSRGVHIVVPLDRSAAFDDVRAFARALMQHTAEANPDLLTIEQRKDKRGKRVFLDYLRNAYGQTAVAPYAVRAIEGAPVATPLKWRELEDSRFHPRRYTIRNVFRRLAQIEAPWTDLPRQSHALKDAEARLKKCP